MACSRTSPSSKGKQKASLEEHREAAKLYRELATVDANVPLDVTLEALRLTPPEPSELDALYRELEFYSLLTGGGADGEGRRARPLSRADDPATRRGRPRRARRSSLPGAASRAGADLRAAGRIHHAQLVGSRSSPPRAARRSTSRSAAEALRLETPPAIALSRRLLADEDAPKLVVTT